MSFLKHIGVKRRSGRYPWGSGKDPEQRNRSFLGYVRQLRKEGLSETEIAKGLGISRNELQAKKTIARAELRAADAALARRLQQKGMSNVAIGKRMGINESSVRALLDPTLEERSNITLATANMLRGVVEKKGLVDVGLGAETEIGISRTKLQAALHVLKEEGYGIHYVDVKQLGTGKNTTMQVLAPPGMEYKDVFRKRSEIKTISDHAYSPDGGRSYLGLKPIQSVDSNKVMIRYREDGGADRDGVIELRRGVKDLSLGNASYAQVRIGVDGTHFLKGMAMYTDDIPDGVDIIYNSNKKKGTPKDQVFKEMKDDKDNPFGTTIKPGGQRGALNIVNEEGDWNEWTRTISSQILSKQSPALAKQQLDLARSIKSEEYDEILRITNPTVRKKLLHEFAEEADSDAVHLKAAALPRQANKVILPITSLKPNEIYAPTFNDGESVVLIRHPHGGIFEIPEVRVNNKSKEARSILGNAIDAVGIHPSVAAKLSGADFDGDHVLVIPNKNKMIQTAPTLKALKDFDTKLAYPPYDGMKTIDQGIYDASTGKVNYGGKKPNPAPKQLKMGDVSNLITDMTIKGASADEIARAVKHSMVVIDSEKHHLDYTRSYNDNGIGELKKKYQGGARSGASTLISRASSEKRLPYVREEGKKVTDPVTGKTKRVYIDPRTGQKLYDQREESFINKQGKLVKRTTVTTKMAEETDAHKLSSGTKIESIYADHANALKATANKARLEMLRTPNLVYSPSARQTYAPEVTRLKAALRLAIENKPRERQAQLLANAIVSAKKQANPDMSKGDLKKIKGQALIEARTRTGANKPKIKITDREWEAIQLGAISNNILSQILDNMDPADIKTRATPRTALKMTDAKIAKAKEMASRGYTTAEIANALGVSTSTVQQTIK